MARRSTHHDGRGDDANENPRAQLALAAPLEYAPAGKGADAMIWVRGNRRIGAWLGLLALALQLVLSFSHIHLGDIAIPQAAAADAAAAPNPATPTNRHPGTHDICAICVALNLTASAVVPTAASLVLPLVFTQAWHPDVEAVLISSEPHLFFQARAPPALI